MTGRVGAFGRRTLWRAVLRASGGFRVEGPVPRQPCVVVANHASHADTAALLAALPARRRPLVAAAQDYWFAGPVRGAVCRGLAAGFPVRRGGRGFDDLVEAARLLARGHTIVVFPEGTRSRDGSVGRFRSGATRLAELADVPLVPAGLTGTARLLPVHGRLRRSAVTVRFGEPTRDATTARLAVCELAGAAQVDQADNAHQAYQIDKAVQVDQVDQVDQATAGHDEREGTDERPDQWEGRSPRRGDAREVGGDARAAGHRGPHQQGDTHRLPPRFRQWLDA